MSKPDSDPGREVFKAAASPWRAASAAFLLPGMALLFYVNFLTPDRSPILSMIAAILMLTGAIVSLIGFSKGKKARKAAGY